MKSDELHNKAFRATLDRNPLGIVITDPLQDDNPVIYVNDGFANITRFDKDYALGRNCRFLQGERTSEVDRRRLREAVQRGEEVNVSILNYKADGTPFVNQLLMAPVHDDEDGLIAFFAVQREITDEAEKGTGGGSRPEHATESEVMLREMQHRVKNHLAMIVSLIRVQAEREVTRESYLALSHRIEALALLYEELLRPQIGHNSEEIDASVYLERVAEVIAGIDGRPSVKLTVDCDKVQLPTDPTARLGLLLTELLTNSLAHAFEGCERGEIRVKLRNGDNGQVRLTVEDNGIGMPEGSEWPYRSASVSNQHEKALQEKGALDTTSRKSHSGLGGSIVLGLTRALDAKLDVRSGKDGTAISLDLAPNRLV